MNRRSLQAEDVDVSEFLWLCCVIAAVDDVASASHERGPVGQHPNNCFSNFVGVPRRLIGTLLMGSSKRSAIASSVIGVFMYPGLTQFTRILSFAYSIAAVLVIPTTPCFAATQSRVRQLH